FFFQAEDGIRDFHVTGVQTCALPIYIIVIDWISGGRCSICYSGGAGSWVWMGYCDWTSHWHRQCHRGWTAKAVYFSLELVDIWLGIIYHHGIDDHAV